MGQKNSRRKRKEPEKEDKSSIEEIPKQSNHKHLICDDTGANRFVLKRYLERFGCTVEEAENGAEAVEMVKENGQYDIIWMDIKMPKMDGIECTEMLRKRYNYKGMIIFVTGFVDKQTTDAALNSGGNFILSKPLDKKIILTYVNDIEYD